MSSSPLRPRSRHPGPQHTRQRLLPHPVQQSHPPRHRRRHRDRKPGEQPELHADVLLLAGVAAPLHGLLGAVVVDADGRADAAAAPALGGRGGRGVFAEEAALSVGRAVVGVELAVGGVGVAEAGGVEGSGRGGGVLEGG